ncbi:hypothetical protein C0993_010784 [Termitomyces sp. T159_Od127]|nr:hypothetical protein C0993_010784 [Termitomyces sp. T159_Od127]
MRSSIGIGLTSPKQTLLRPTDRIEFFSSVPNQHARHYTYTLEFPDGIPLFVVAAAAKAITQSKPFYQLLTTNCFFFAEVFREILKKYGLEQNVEVHKVKENVVLGCDEQEGMEHKELGHEGAEQSLGYAKAGTYQGIPILGSAAIQTFVASVYPVLDRELQIFQEKLGGLRDALTERDNIIGKLREQLQTQGEMQGEKEADR